MEQLDYEGKGDDEERRRALRAVPPRSAASREHARLVALLGDIYAPAERARPAAAARPRASPRERLRWAAALVLGVLGHGGPDADVFVEAAARLARADQLLTARDGYDPK
jgi:hypothetical protein